MLILAGTPLRAPSQGVAGPSGALFAHGWPGGSSGGAPTDAGCAAPPPPRPTGACGGALWRIEEASVSLSCDEGRGPKAASTSRLVA